MREFERALMEARPPDLHVDEFRRALRRDLVREERRRRGRRARLALGGMAATAAALASFLVLFVLRPSIPQGLHSALVESPQAAGVESSGAGRGDTLPGRLASRDPGLLLSRTGATAAVDQQWLDGLYERQPDRSRVQALEEERLFALRRFRLTSGRSIVVLTEIGGDPLSEPETELSAIQEF